MVADAFFEQHYVWQVYFETLGSMFEITLSYRRARADGSGITFDEDPQIRRERILDLRHDEDDRLVMDGLLAIIPDGKQLSCAMRVLRRYLLIFKIADYGHIFAGADKTAVKRVFDGRLFNTDGTNGDIVFIGGEHAAHETATIKHWSKVIQHNVLPQSGAALVAAWEHVLTIYEAVVWTLSTEIHLIMRNDHDPIAKARPALAEVAARYGFVLPPK